MAPRNSNVIYRRHITLAKAPALVTNSMSILNIKAIHTADALLLVTSADLPQNTLHKQVAHTYATSADSTIQ